MLRPKVSRAVLALMCAMSFILYLDRVNLSAAAGLIRDDLHLSNTNVGLVFAAFAYTYALCQVIGGWVSDRFGAKLTLVTCASIWIVATVATGLAGGLASLFGARLLLGIGEGAALPAQARALTNWFPSNRRGFVQGLTHSFSRLGNAITPPLIALLVAYSSWRVSFLAVGALTFVWVVVYAWYFTDDPRKHRHMTAEQEAQLPPVRQSAVEATREPTPWRRLLKRIAPTMLVYFCYGWTGWLFFTWLPTFFMHGRGLDLKSSAMFSAGRVSVRRGRQYRGRRAQRPRVEAYAQRRRGAPQRDHLRVSRRFGVPRAGDGREVAAGHGSVHEPVVLLPRNDDRADLGRADGHLPAARRCRERARECGLGGCGDFHADRVRPDRGPHG
ncbi:MFS family permease [Paraburkholderia sp. MM5496-R1]